jgi:hypothetical protein
MEASSKEEAIASVRARKATTEEQAPLVATGLKKSAMAQEMEMVMGPTPTPVVLAAVKDRPGDLSCKSPASVAAKQEHVDGLDGIDQNLLARAKYTARLRNKELLTTLYTSSSPVVAPAAAVEQSSSAHAFVSALPAPPIEDLVSFAFVEATENIGNVHGSAVLAAVKDPPCRTPGVLLLPTNEPIELMGVFTMDTPRSEAVYASPAPSTAHAPMREHAAERDVEPGGQQNIAFATNQARVASEEEPRTWNPVEFASGSFLEHCALRVPFPLTSSSPSASVNAYLDFALVSAILRTVWTTYLVRIKYEDAAPCPAWEREGIGTGPWN